MTNYTKSYECVESWGRNAQHVLNSTAPHDPDPPDWLTCSAERFINYYLPLFESGQLDPDTMQAKTEHEQ